MGHNDICSGTIERIQADCAEGDDQDPMNHCRTTEAAFEREFRKGLDVLIAVPELKIGIAAPVRVSQLCNSRRLKQTALVLAEPADPCGGRIVLLSLRETGLCGSITIDCSDERRPRRLRNSSGLSRHYGARLLGVCRLGCRRKLPLKWKSAVRQLGGKSRRPALLISFSNATWVYKFTSEQISCCDCFHPSFLGQDAAAQILFDGFTCSPTDVCCADTGDPVSDALCTAEDTGGTFHPGLF